VTLNVAESLLRHPEKAALELGRPPPGWTPDRYLHLDASFRTEAIPELLQGSREPFLLEDLGA
jgi:hypothetical protein